jgi:hypothetical protein
MLLGSNGARVIAPFRRPVAVPHPCHIIAGGVDAICTVVVSGEADETRHPALRIAKSVSPRFFFPVLAGLPKPSLGAPLSSFCRSELTQVYSAPHFEIAVAGDFRCLEPTHNALV